MKLGIVGLPNVGKSTLFNALSEAGAQSANYPFCTIEPNVGIVPVADQRLATLGQMHESAKITHAVIEFVDIAGLVKGASRGEGLGNKFLSHIREVDAIVHVVRCFEDSDIVHVDNSVDPARDVETINIELMLADLETVDKRLERVSKQAKGDKSLSAEAELLEKIKTALEKGQMAQALDYDEAQTQILKQTPLLTMKPQLFAANLSEEDFAGPPTNNPFYQALERVAHGQGSVVLPVAARMEEEMVGMSDDEKKLFLGELGIEETGLERLVKKSYELLGLISYLTTGKDETKAWTITKGTKAPQAAGKIHSDFERGFIKADVIGYDRLVQAGSMAKARENGLVRSEGKEYIMQDGDVVLFKFNV